MFRAVLILSVVLVSLTGCKNGPRPSAKTARAAKTTPPLKNISPKPSDKAVAARTKAVTQKRQGTWSITSDKVKEVSKFVTEIASEYQLPEDLIYGIIWVESRFDPKAVSPVGARGLMQLMPRTATYLAECIDWSGRANPFDPHFNITAGTYYIARLIRQFDGDEDLALAAYNAGPTKVRRWLADDGLPDVSIEYAAMVQTARTFFNRSGNTAPSGPSSPSAKPPSPAPPITDEALDRLGLTILIAGLSDKDFGMEREDDANPFE